MTSVQTEIILIRHGETHFNLEGKIQGHLDSHLTDKGIAQARALIPRVTSLKPTQIYTSDLSRAQHTAQILGESLGLRPKIECRVKETSFGKVEGQSWSEIRRTLGDKVAQAWHHHQSGIKMPGGESREEVLKRGLSALQDITKEHQGQKICVVTHGGVLATLFAHILQIPPGVRPACLVLNTSLSIICHQESAWKIKTWGDVSHLEGSPELLS